MPSTPAAQIDLRAVPPPRRHPLIFSTFDALPAGGAFEIVNDHDPLPLYVQFESTRLGLFDWHDLEHGPDRWRVRIAKLGQGEPGATPQGCGARCGCGGGGGR